MMSNKLFIFTIKVLRRFNVFKYLNLSIKVKRESILIDVPLLGGIGFNNIFEDEPWMNDIFSILGKQIKKGSFIDVGVNIGQTLIKVKSHFENSINY